MTSQLMKFSKEDILLVMDRNKDDVNFVNRFLQNQHESLSSMPTIDLMEIENKLDSIIKLNLK